MLPTSCSCLQGCLDGNLRHERFVLYIVNLEISIFRLLLLLPGLFPFPTVVDVAFIILKSFLWFESVTGIHGLSQYLFICAIQKYTQNKNKFKFIYIIILETISLQFPSSSYRQCIELCQLL